MGDKSVVIWRGLPKDWILQQRCIGAQGTLVIQHGLPQFAVCPGQADTNGLFFPKISLLTDYCEVHPQRTAAVQTNLTVGSLPILFLVLEHLVLTLPWLPDSPMNPTSTCTWMTAADWAYDKPDIKHPVRNTLAHKTQAHSQASKNTSPRNKAKNKQQPEVSETWDQSIMGT